MVARLGVYNQTVSYDRSLITSFRKPTASQVGFLFIILGELNKNLSVVFEYLI